MRVRKKCRHGKYPYQCVQCGGASMCEHKKRRAECKKCKGSAFCQHGKRQHVCVECGGAGICKHKRIRASCKDCKGSAFCPCGREKNKCVDCGGAGICVHQKRREGSCPTCDPLGYLAKRLRSAARGAITRGGDVKDRPTLDYYGVETFQELKDFLQLKMDHHNSLWPLKDKISFDNFALDHI